MFQLALAAPQEPLEPLEHLERTELLETEMETRTSE